MTSFFMNRFYNGTVSVTVLPYSKGMAVMAGPGAPLGLAGITWDENLPNMALRAALLTESWDLLQGQVYYVCGFAYF